MVSLPARIAASRPSAAHPPAVLGEVGDHLLGVPRGLAIRAAVDELRVAHAGADVVLPVPDRLLCHGTLHRDDLGNELGELLAPQLAVDGGLVDDFLRGDLLSLPPGVAVSTAPARVTG